MKNITPINGISGAVTKAAIARFQRDNRLKPIGKVDNETLEALVNKYNNAMGKTVPQDKDNMTMRSTQ